ncbi:MAG: RNA polymerase sporulation sigma factor SigK [Acutalibacter sp.]|nr:RNA polymerase sporulation sigma factor SigK [Acutalibacter sp.]
MGRVSDEGARPFGFISVGRDFLNLPAVQAVLWSGGHKIKENQKGVAAVFFAQLLDFLSNIFYLFLHVTGNGTFPKALTGAQEKKCLEEMAAGSASARRTLIEHNLRLVAHIVKKYYASQNDQEDLISIGTIGLIKAIDSFDPGKGIRLSSYASKCIENEILMFFRSGKKSAQDVSINEPIDTDKDGNSLTIMDTMAVEDTIIDNIDVRMKSEKLYGFIDCALSKREKDIVCMRYGLLGHAAMPQRVVAKRLGISRSYVSRIEKKALEKLRAEFGEGEY